MLRYSFPLLGEGAFKKLEEISKGNHWLITRDLQSWPAYLNERDARSILQATQASRESTMITAPRLTLFNGQRAYVLVSRQTPFIGVDELK